jgi:lysosomal alpha-mannosidase
MVLLEGDRILSKVYFSRTVNYVRNYGFMIESFVDSISIADDIGKEVTLNIQTKYKNLRTFYTDSMGMEEQKRVLNYRPSWNYTVY